MDRHGSIGYSHGLETHRSAISLSSFDSENADNMAGLRKDHHRLKSSQWRILAWVAVSRNNNRRISQEQRCTCPMAGCRQWFHSSELMHMHLKDSTCISGSSYHCFETDQIVRFGKCDCPGCHDLKGRLTIAVSSSIKSLRRHLSKRRSRSPRRADEEPETEPSSPIDCAMEMDDTAAALKCLELPLDPDMPCAEVAGSIPGPYDISRHELEGIRYPTISELNSTPIPYAQSFNPIRSSPNVVEPLSNYTVAPYEMEEQRTTISFPTNGHRHEIPPSYGYDGSIIHQNGQAQYSSEIWTRKHEQVALVQQLPPLYSYGDNGFHHDGTWVIASQDPGNYYAAFQPNSDPQVGIETPSASTYRDQEHTYPSSVQAHEILQYNDEMVADVDVMSSRSPIDRRRNPREGSGSSSASGHSYLVNSSLLSGSFRSSASTGRTSMTSLTPSSLAGAHQLGKTFLGDDATMFEEPEDMEPSPIATTYERRRPRRVRADARRVDAAGVSIDNWSRDNFSTDYQPPMQSHIQRTSTAYPLPSAPHFSPSGLLSGTSVSTPPRNSESASVSEYSPASFLSASPQALSLGKAYCRHCNLSCDMSNRSRHEKACKDNPDSANAPRIPCLYPGCLSTFTRKDNLAHHQRSQNHFAVGNVEMKMTFTPTPGSPVWKLAMQAFGQGCEIPVETQGNESWMDQDNEDEDVAL
ncbi:hypothetical protein VTL71DRAFT_9664 [Oculimacula yallundae]|uniref:C2H2-type domain-containing protein n=1 Tax=Oculimacula yallundae TaxID=86028 RepID=A0ABR4BRI2_9HELO